MQACEIVPTTAEHHRISKAKASFCSRPFQASPLSAAKLCLLFLPPPPQSQSASQFSAAVADGALFSPLGNFGDVSGAAINLLWWRRSGGAWATLPSLVDVPDQERRRASPSLSARTAKLLCAKSPKNRAGKLWEKVTDSYHTDDIKGVEEPGSICG